MSFNVVFEFSRTKVIINLIIEFWSIYYKVIINLVIEFLSTSESFNLVIEFWSAYFKLLY